MYANDITSRVLKRQISFTALPGRKKLCEKSDTYFASVPKYLYLYWYHSLLVLARFLKTDLIHLKHKRMKKTLIVIAMSILVFGCNMNPSKETRIQKLESENQQLMQKVNQLEKKLEELEIAHEQLKKSIPEN